MDLLSKTKETAGSVLPVAAIVVALGFGPAPLGAAAVARFLFGAVLLVAGLSLFLAGVDAGIQPFGERAGAALTSRRNLPLLLGATLAIGIVVTAAEPDIQVFGDQVRRAVPSVRKLALTASIAGGVGLFLSLGLARIVSRVPLKAALLAAYAALGAAACFAPPAFHGIAFDSGGATTGPMTVPFVLALGLGVARVRGDPDASFGLTGLASVGPVLAVLLYGLALGPSSGASAAASASAASAAAGGGFLRAVFAPFAAALPGILSESLSSILPLFALFCVFRATLLRMGRVQFLRHVFGFLWAFAGLAVFLLGATGGFMPAGAALGESLGAAARQGPGGFALLLAAGVAFGAIVVCAEPAVWVLCEQVEAVSGGTVRRRALMVFLSAGTAAAVGLALWRAVAGFPLWRVLLPGYAVAMLAMLRCPALFTGIAFDSGGVASGPLTSTFLLSFALGAASGGAGASDSFGVVALVALMPLVAIQTMGILYDRGRRRAARREARRHGEERPT